MTTRSGLTYNAIQGDSGEMSQQSSSVSVGDLLKILVDSQQRQAEAEERRRAAEDEERRRRLVEEQRRQEESERQMALIARLLEKSTLDDGRDRKPRERDAQLVRLTDKDDIETYLTTFERVMEAYEVDRNRWTFKLAPYLSGRAQEVYGSLAAEAAANYEQLKEAILVRYGIREETYRMRFRSTKKKAEETYRELGNRLQDTAKKWLRDYESKEELLDVLVKEQFVNSLPTILQVWIREREPETSEAAFDLADSFVHARECGSGNGMGRSGLKNEGPGMDNSQDKPRCFKCGEEGHFAGRCHEQGAKAEQDAVKRQSYRADSSAGSKVKCYNCSKTGHVARRCPESALFAGSRCKDTLLERNVTRRGTVEGTKVQDIILDTGCSRTLVRKDLVPPSKWLEERAVVIKCAHGDAVMYPLASVDLMVDGTAVNVEAALSDTLPAAVLLGRDVPELHRLLQEPRGAGRTSVHGAQEADEAMVVTTRAGARKKPREIEEDSEQGEEQGEEKEKAVRDNSHEQEQWDVGDVLDDDLFVDNGRLEKTRLSRSQKRLNRKQFQSGDKNRSTEEETEENIADLDFGAEELRRLQQADETLHDINQLAERGDPQFVKKSSLVYRKTSSTEDHTVEQLVLPRQCRAMVLKLAHETPLAGHLGRNKTTRRVLQRFYWPGVCRDVAKHCRCCPECQKAQNRREQPAPLVPLPVMAEPFARIAMDIVGPLPRSKSGHKYILVICDYATRYPEAVPLRSCEAEKIAEELIKLFSRMGIPKEILTDQGSNFTSKLLAELYNMLQVRAIRTTPYHPQTDGLVERFNQTLKAMLRRMVNKEGKDWDRLLPFLLFAYREVPQASTGFSPFELLFGRKIRGPLDVIKERWEADHKSSESVVSYILSIQDRIASMADLVGENMQKAQETQKRWYDRNAREKTLEPGEKVLVLLPTSSNKLLAQWQGPYTVEKRVSDVTYQVMSNKRKRHRVFHVNMLRQWHDQQPTDWSLWVDDTEEAEDEIPVWGKDDTCVQWNLPPHLDEMQKRSLQGLLKEFEDTLKSKPGRTRMIEHSIDTGSAQAIRLPPYRLPYAYRDVITKELKEMLEEGVISRSTSEWAAPVVLITKKNGEIRFCVDYRRLNSISRTDSYPMPRVDELIDRLGSANYISTLDLSRGYWQVPMSAQSRAKTAFVTSYGLFEFNVMPFGLQGAPSTFQRMMDQLLRGLEDCAAAYLDDLVIHNATWPEHLASLRKVLERLRTAGLTAKPSKCHFAMKECTYLGHIVGNGQVRPEIGKLTAVEDFPVPKTKKEVRTFLGLTGYYRKFVPCYASLAAPLTELTRSNAPTIVKWTTSCNTAFMDLKRLLCSSPVLQCPDFSRPFILQTDASDWGVGGVLSQLDQEGLDHPVAYFSRKLLPRERRYATVEKECLAIKLAIQAFRVYLLGKPFRIVTDHHALEWLRPAQNR